LGVDESVVRRRLRRLERAVRVLRELRALGPAVFLHDEGVQDRAERNAQLAAQTCADVALHIVAALGRSAPETYADAIVELAKAGVITEELVAPVSGAVRLRNLLVHEYLEVDHARLFDELSWVDATAMFAEQVERWMETHR
jgi:uncharacterized protein YutE (UPF0331/DUF86 family)